MELKFLKDLEFGKVTKLLIDLKTITPIGILKPIDTVEYKFEVYPVVCLISDKPSSFNKSEVQNLYYVPIQELEKEKNWVFRGHYDSDWVFDIDGEVLWGATAKMVRNLLNIFKIQDILTTIL